MVDKKSYSGITKFVRNNKVLSGYTTGFGVICKKLEKKETIKMVLFMLRIPKA